MQTNLDGDFGIIKSAIRNRVRQMAVTGPDSNKPNCDFTTPREVVQYLMDHPWFGTNDNNEPDELGYYLHCREPREAVFHDHFCKYCKSSTLYILL